MEDSMSKRTYLAAFSLVVVLGLISTLACDYLGMVGGTSGASTKSAELSRGPTLTTNPNFTTPLPLGTAAANRTPTGAATATTAPPASPRATGTVHATYTPLLVVTAVPALPAGASTVSLQGNLYTGVKVYMKSTGEYLFEILGRAVDCPVDSANSGGAAYRTRLANAREQWTPEKSMQSYAASGVWVVRADDPILKTKLLTQLTGCQ
jgi:hypothetical protein